MIFTSAARSADAEASSNASVSDGEGVVGAGTEFVFCGAGATGVTGAGTGVDLVRAGDDVAVVFSGTGAVCSCVDVVAVGLVTRSVGDVIGMMVVGAGAVVLLENIAMNTPRASATAMPR